MSFTGAKYLTNIPVPPLNTLVSIQHDWWPSFALFPHKTISGKFIWLKPCYKRVVWRYTGFTDEPFTEYATVLDILADTEEEYTV